MNNNNKVQFSNEWERKFVRESWTFPFGSLMQAYAQIHQGDIQIQMETIKKDAQDLFELAVSMTEQALIRSQQSLDTNEEPDVPLEKEGGSVDLVQKEKQSYLE